MLQNKGYKLLLSIILKVFQTNLGRFERKINTIIDGIR